MTLYNRFVRWAGERRLGRHVPCARRDGRSSGAGADRQFRGQGAPLRRRGERGERAQAIGRSRGGRTTKIHALTDAACRPIALLLTGGQIADCTAAALLLEKMQGASILLATKVTTATPFAGRPKTRARCRICRLNQTGAGRIASRRSFIETATLLSACSAASRITAASPPATIVSPATSSPPSASPQPSVTGCKSRP